MTGLTVQDFVCEEDFKINSGFVSASCKPGYDAE